EHLRFATNRGGSWAVTTIETVPRTGIDELHDAVINIDGSDNLHVFYVKEDGQNDYYGNLYYTSKSAAAGSWAASVKIIDAVSEGKSYYYSAPVTDVFGHSSIGYSLSLYDNETNFLSSTVYLHTNESGVWSRQTLLSATDRDLSVTGMELV